MTANELLSEFNRVMKLKPCNCKGQWVKGKWTIVELCNGHRVIAKYDAFLSTQGN